MYVCCVRNSMIIEAVNKLACQVICSVVPLDSPREHICQRKDHSRSVYPVKHLLVEELLLGLLGIGRLGGLV